MAGGNKANISPPFANLPFVNLVNGLYMLTVPAFQALQTLWAAVVPTPLTAATLPTNPSQGQNAFVTDSALSPIGNFGQPLAGGGANPTPVWFDGAIWRLG